MAATAPNDSPKVLKRELFGWAMYDFASSSYTTVVISLLYSSFFVGYIVPAGSAIRDTYWSIAIVASTILAIIFSPLIGAICDYSGSKKRYLKYAMIVCSTSTAALFFVQPGQIWLAVFLIAISNFGFMLGEAFCASFLTDLATKKNMGLISGLGWGLGYFGGLTSLVIVQLAITAEPEGDLAAFVVQNQFAMVLIGVFFAVSSLPMFLLVRERSKPKPGYEEATMADLFQAGIAELRQSIPLMKRYNVLFKFFLAFMVYMAGLEIVIKFIGIYATSELNLTTGDLIQMFLILQLSAAAGALGFGVLESRLGAKRTVLLTIVWWILGILAIYWLQNIADALGASVGSVFLGIAIVAGSGIGSIQSSSRAVVGLLSPADRSAQMFGFWAMFMRMSIIFGMAFGPISDSVGRRTALLLVVGYFVLGGIMLLFVPIDKEAERLAALEDAAAA